MSSEKSAFLTKILVPRRRPDIVRRERLLNILRSGGDVAVVRAPAGFGKTTLLVDLVHDSGSNICWVSLDDWDHDARVFLTYLEEAVSRSVGNRRQPEAGREPRAALGRMVTRLAEAGGETWIVLDDFHCVETSPEVVMLVDELSVRLPENCRLFITSRTPPPLPSLPRLRLQRRVTEIGPEELAFTREELSQYRRNTAGEEISPDEADAFLQSTQGWPAAVVLLTQTGGLTEKAGPVEEYMAAEILARLPADVQEFLLLTSPLETLRADACEELAGTGNAAEVLSRLDKLNVPTLRLQTDEPEYRIHSLFRDFLRARLRAQSPKRYRELNARAGEWLAERGRTAEAVVQLADAEKWEALSKLIEREAPAAYRLGRWHLIMSWLHLFPREELAKRAPLKLWEIRIRVRMGQADEALRELRDPDLESAVSDPVLVAELAVLQATALRMKGEARAALEAARRGVDLSISANVPVEASMEARKQLGLALCVSGAFTEALPELRTVLEFYSRRGDEEQASFVYGILGSALSAQGNLIEGIRNLELALQGWRRIGNGAELGWVLNNLAVAYHRAGQTELARERADEGIRIARETGDGRQEAYSITSLADIERTAGEVDRALELYGEARSLCEQLAQQGLMTHVLTGLSHARRALGQYDLAEVLAREALSAAETTGSQFEKGLALLALGRLQRARDQFEEAVATLNEAAALFDRSDSHRELAETLYYLADAGLPVRQGRSLVKLTLERLAGIVSRLGADDFLSYVCRESPAPLQYAAANNLGRGYYRQLLRRLTPAPPGRVPGTVEVFALGGFRAVVDGREIMSLEWQTESAKEMFLLLLWEGRALTRDEVIASLWPDASLRRAASLFHSTLHRIRRALFRDAVVEESGRYRLNPAGRFFLDAIRFQELTRQAAGQAFQDGDRLGRLREAARLYKGPFAGGLKGEWLEGPRRNLEARFLELATELAEELIQAGRHKEAISVCEQALRYDAYSETAHAALMKAQAALGDSDAAERTFRHYAEILKRELDEEPGEAISELHSRLKQQPIRGGRRVL